MLDVVGAAQEPDGYLYTARTINPQQLAEAGARSDAQRLYPVGQSLSEEEGGEYGLIHHHDVYQRPYLREFLGCPGSECSEYQHPLSLWSLSPE